jgi:hypothetical protein
MKLLLIILLILLSACPLKEVKQETGKIYKVGELPNANGIGYYEVCKKEGSNEIFRCN